MGIQGDRAHWEAESEGVTLLENLTIGDLLDRQAEKLADQEALVYNYPELGIDLRLNYRQYRDEVNKLAKGLLALGIQKGEHVAIWAPNLPQWVFLSLATAKIGAVLVTINTAYRAAELEYVLRQGDITTLFMVEEFRANPYLESVYSIAPELKSLADPAGETLQSQNLPRLKRVVLIGQVERPGLLLYSQVIELGQQISDEALKERQASVKMDDAALIMYTSGTTGFPKGAVLTHNNILNDMQSVSRGQSFSNDRYVSPMPLFHIAGSNFIPLCLLHGTPLIPLIAFDPVKWMELIEKEKGTLTFLVPTMIIAVINHPRLSEFDISTLRIFYTGGASVPVALIEQANAKLGAECMIFFGQTENTGGATLTRENDSSELKSTTVGVPLPHVNIKIVNPSTGETVGFGEKGELLIKGFNVMKGYYNMPEKTAETIRDGWLHTGDLATMNEQGYINIVGRVKEMIIRGGENIYPAEVEAFTMRHPKVAETQLVGVPDTYMGEEAVALIRLKPGQEATEQEIREFLRANLSHYKVPKYIKFVTEYPMTVSGKVKKFELKEQLIKELGLEEVAKTKTA